ncbi:hypothetical protein HJ588_05435 [Flexivirga sp. ID2601S]|uniref:Uncharacterized protein n=1 Tax=Flexivirga aerilata TaxID=1656889 RepID=A0A849AGN2_9MICO|nr:hypothetical protein [Flexivirga aerilata]NNG38716.1 hypothetical protein [Flexivirga aerilata]
MALDKVKKVVIWVVVAFIAYAIFTSPSRSADIVHSIWQILSDGVDSIGTFFDRILNR